MTENEAIEWLAEETSPTLIHIAEMKKENPMEYINEAVKVACDALEEIQQYRALGTVEELKTFKDGFAVDFANMGYEKGLRDGYSKAKAYYKEQMKGGE